eukprot:Hpha_TRINITY_DN9025_c0_g1::TRINITY_DN9025_c0_g1_i1::g.141946::m.141946
MPRLNPSPNSPAGMGGGLPPGMGMGMGGRPPGSPGGGYTQQKVTQEGPYAPGMQPGGPLRGAGKGGGGSTCFHCGDAGHHSSQCPLVMKRAEQAELTVQQTCGIVTHWGIEVDPKLRLQRPPPGFPVSGSAEFQMLLGWTLIGVNGVTPNSEWHANELLGKLARPGEKIRLLCRSPLPEDDFSFGTKKLNSVCNDWRKGICKRDNCRYLHQAQVLPEDVLQRVQQRAEAKAKAKRGPACFTCGCHGHTAMECKSYAYANTPKQEPVKKPLLKAATTSAAEAAVDQLISRVGGKRPRKDSGPGEMGGGMSDDESSVEEDTDTDLVSILMSMRDDLKQIKEKVVQRRLENESLRVKCLEAEKRITKQQVNGAAGEADEEKLEKKYEKAKGKLEKLKEAERERQRGEVSKAKAAVSKTISGCTDVDILALSSQQARAALETDDAWALLGLVPGQATLDQATSKARELAGQYNPRQVQLPVVKKSLERRISLAELALSLLTPGGEDTNEA